MKSIVLADQEDTLVGLRLAGIEGEYVDNQATLLTKLNQYLDDEAIGIIMITKHLMDMAEEEILEMKLKSNATLIIGIPNMGGSIGKDFLTNYIQDSIGLKL
jgi:V/A-type H+-transporting ATPase subunit F